MKMKNVNQAAFFKTFLNIATTTTVAMFDIY